MIIIADAQNDYAEDRLCVDTVGSEPVKSIRKRVKTITSWNVKCPVSSSYWTSQVQLAVERDG